MATELRQRLQSPDEVPTGNLSIGVGGGTGKDGGKEEHPSGKESHGRWMQGLRVLAFATYFTSGCIAYVLSL